jgi:hypothetical protein
MSNVTEQDTPETEDELIPVETPEAEEPAEQPSDEDESDDSDEEDGDERLGDAENEDGRGEPDSNRERRRKRREMQKLAKERTRLELEMLRHTNAEMQRRLAALEGNVAQTGAQTIEQKLAAAQREVELAEQVIAKATAAGNGDDVVQAMRIRDAAIANANQLTAARQQYDQQRAPRIDPTTLSYAQQWLQANPWYDPSGRDADSAATKAIDNQLAREGFDPKTRGYWEELTRRVAATFGEAPAAPKAAEAKTSKPRKTPPPTGSTREHAPVSTKKEIYVTPERKQAMIEAGVWDDPVQRQRYLKAYQAYDTGSAR